MSVFLLILKILGLVILGIILLIVLVLCLPCYVYVSFETELKADVRFCFIRFPVYPSDKDEPGLIERMVLKFWHYLIGLDPSGKQSNAQTLADIGDEAGFKELFADRGASGAVRFLWQVLCAVFGRFVKVFRGVYVKKLELLVGITGDDAADTAIRFGKLCGVIYPSLSFILQNVRKYKSLDEVDIHADYQSPYDQVKLDTTLVIRPLTVLWHVIALIFELIVSETKNQVEIKMAAAQAQPENRRS